MDEIFRKAAKSALWEWRQSDDGLDDLVQDIWQWYLARPSSVSKFANSDAKLVTDLVRSVALKMLQGQSVDEDIFNSKWVYSSSSVRAALRGETDNEFLVELLPEAIKRLALRNSGHYNAISSRYVNGVVPEPSSAEAAMLKRAVKSLTEIVNRMAITADLPKERHGDDKRRGPSARSRRASGGHSDPTATIALMLLKRPRLREAYYEETPIREFLGGRGYVQPVR